MWKDRSDEGETFLKLLIYLRKYVSILSHRQKGRKLKFITNKKFQLAELTRKTNGSQLITWLSTEKNDPDLLWQVHWKCHEIGNHDSISIQKLELPVS